MNTFARIAVLIVVALSLPAAALAADLRVCADPAYMPFSNRAGQGFENKIAAAVAKALGDSLVYSWASQRGPGGFDQFLHDTLNAHKCDVVIDVPYASENVLTTRPYYISSYVFIFPKSKGYDITSMDSAALKNLRIGYETETPAESGLKLRALTTHAVPFESTDSPDDSPLAILNALASGKIAVAVTWEPAVGYYLLSRPQLSVVMVPNARSQGSPEQYSFPMSMAARLGDDATRNRLDGVIRNRASELTAILEHNGVRLYKPAAAASE